MATAFINTEYAYSSSSLFATVGAPTGTQDDDLMIAMVWCTVDASSTPPSGWTLRAVVGTRAVFTKVASSESGTYNFYQVGGTPYPIAARIWSYRGGFDVADPVDAVSGAAYTTFNDILRAQTFSVTSENSNIIFVGDVYSAAAITISPPTNPTTFNEDSEIGSNAHYMYAASCLWSGSGATGEIDATISASKNDKFAAALALNPSSTANYSAELSGGSYSLSGGSIDASVGKNAELSGGSYSLSGAPIETTVERSVELNGGVYSLSGASIDVGPSHTVGSYRNIIENGGGDIAYLWHVSGYPWAVTDTPALIEALSDTSDYVVQEARKRLFGSNTFDLDGNIIVPAYNVPIFPVLKQDFGNVKWDIDVSRSIITGGDWKVKIEDRILGHNWDHCVEGDEIWGLEGLHRVVDLQDSLISGWGWLAYKLPREESGGIPSTISVNEQSGSILYDRLSGLSEDEYVVLWMDHEAIAVNGVTGSYPAYSIAIVDSGVSGRGLYRSRVHDHHMGRIAGLNPTIADVPGSIIGHFCWLYRIPLDSSGRLFLTSDDEPLIVEEMRGVVSPNVGTVNAETSISIRDEFAATEKRISLDVSKSIESNLQGFIFTRGDVGSSNLNEISRRWQIPHLVVTEFVYSFDSLLMNNYISYFGADSFTKVGFKEVSGTNEIINTEYWHENYIWLCEPGETIMFETAQDVVDALNEELAACYNNSSRHSSDTNLKHKYIVTKYDVYGYSLNLDEYHVVTGDSENERNKKRAMLKLLNPYIAGPLAWVFNLGVPLDESNLYTIIKNNYKSKNEPRKYPGADIEYYGDWTPCHPLLETCGYSLPLDTTEDTFKTNYWMRATKKSDVGSQSVAEDYRTVPRYYYSFPWNEYADVIRDRNINDDTDIVPPILDVPYTPIRIDSDQYRIFLKKDTSIDGWSEDESFSLGVPSDDRRTPTMYGSIYQIQESDKYDFVEVVLDSGMTYYPDDYVPFVGLSLFRLEIIDDEIDEHAFSKSLAAETDKLSYIFRSILGESIPGISIAIEMQLSFCPFFTTVGDFVSSIDWDSLDRIKTLSNLFRIRSDQIADNVFDLLKNELLYNASFMVREFDHNLLMWRYRFRNIEGINASYAHLSNLKLLEGKTLRGAPAETHGIGEIYNIIHIEPINVNITYVGLTYVGTTEKRILKIKPALSDLPKAGNKEELNEFYDNSSLYYYNMLRALSSPTVEYVKGITLMQSLFPVGREILVTDQTAHRPFTHSLGLELHPCLSVGMQWNYKNNSGEITYRVGGSMGMGTISYGYAPACYLESGNFTKSVGTWSGYPNAHEFTSDDMPDDVYYFDCFDLSDPDNPVVRTDCGCDRYAVLAIDIDTYNAAPLPFTCSVQSDTGRLVLTGDTSSISESKDYVIIFASWDDLEDCQKIWVTHADDLNTIGSSSIKANRLV